MDEYDTPFKKSPHDISIELSALSADDALHQRINQVIQQAAENNAGFILEFREKEYIFADVLKAFKKCKAALEVLDQRTFVGISARVHVGDVVKDDGKDSFAKAVWLVVHVVS